MSESMTPPKRPGPGPATASKPKADGAAEGIHVHKLMFRQGQGLELPGAGAFGANVLTSGGPPNKDRYEITYLPRMRHHQVIYHPAGGTRPPRTLYIPESWCWFETGDTDE